MWYLLDSIEVVHVLDYLNTNNQQHTSLSFDEIIKKLPELSTSSNVRLVISYHALTSILYTEDNYQSLIKFLQSNYIVVLSREDMLFALSKVGSKLIELDQTPNADHVTLFTDALPRPDHLGNQLQHLRVKRFPHSVYCILPAILGSSIEKVNPKYDFLITTINKNPDRNMLVTEIASRKNLENKGLVSARSVEEKSRTWVGETAKLPEEWRDANPSMDLYNNSWLEVVPETFASECCYVTEKTCKPISTKTPFLILSTTGYLKYLHSLGFKTFGSIIDESYDDEVDNRLRIKKLVDVLEDIVINIGAENFYNQCRPILDHNYAKLAEIDGCRINTYNFFIHDCLKELDKPE